MRDGLGFNTVKLGSNEFCYNDQNIQPQIAILLKTTRLQRTNFVGPELFSVT